MIYGAFAIVLGCGAFYLASWRCVALYFAALLLVALAIFNALGNARPGWSPYPDLNHVSVVDEVTDEPHRYFAWVIPDNATAPIAISFPWNEAAANLLQLELSLARNVHGHVRFHVDEGEVEPFVSTITPLPPKGAGQ